MDKMRKRQFIELSKYRKDKVLTDNVSDEIMFEQTKYCTVSNRQNVEQK